MSQENKGCRAGSLQKKKFASFRQPRNTWSGENVLYSVEPVFLLLQLRQIVSRYCTESQAHKTGKEAKRSTVRCRDCFYKPESTAERYDGIGVKGGTVFLHFLNL